jgi:hypothetical protein
MQVQEMEAVVRQSQAYAQTLQNYNTSLQADVQVGRDGGLLLCSQQNVPSIHFANASTCSRPRRAA